MVEKIAPTVASTTSEEKTASKAGAVKKPVTKSKNPDIKSKSHPSTASMVKAAIKALAERNGSSLQAIKKFIDTTYKLDAEKHSSFIKKFLKSAVADGTLVQVKGKGANGSFKLAVSKAKLSVKSKPKPTGQNKTPTEKKIVTKKSTTRKPTKSKTTAAAKKSASPKKEIKKAATGSEKKFIKQVAPKTVKTKTTSPKAKKVTKSPTSKPKAPKPKKVTTAKGTKAAAKK